ncbi:MAG: CoA transferase [Deltaproteobacteria bacterium]|nr:CoA transferase [Deltaproteobacteria bacterium]
MKENNSFQILHGIRVLDLSRLYPGPFCSMNLSDFGANVIRIEGMQYKDQGLGWDTIMRNKRHMALDLKNTEGRKVFYRLVKESDVLIEGFRPGVAKKLKIDYPTLRTLNEKLIYCSITGFGQEGPYRSVAGHDVNYIGLAGILYHTRQKGQKPTLPSVQIGDAAAGGLYATIGILLALIAREQTGRGQYIDISMLDGLISFLPFFLHFVSTERKMPNYDNCHVLGAYAYYNVYETKDQKYITLGALEARFWENICRQLGREDFIPYQHDDSKREDIIEWFTSAFLEKTQAEWWEELKGMDVCLGKVNNMADAMRDAQVRSRNMFQTINHPKKGEIDVIGQPIKMSCSAVNDPNPPASRFGEHTEEILKELGLSQEDIERFYKRGQSFLAMPYRKCGRESRI